MPWMLGKEEADCDVKEGKKHSELFLGLDCPHSEGKYGTGDLKVVMASKIHFTFLRLATDIKPCLSRLWSP